MKVKNIVFSGFAAAILMGVGAANAVVSDATYNLANTGYVDAKVGQVDAKLAGYATTAQLDDYQQKLSEANAGDNIAISEEDGVVKIGASNVVKTGDVWTAADGVNAGADNEDTTAYLNAAAAIDNKVPSVAAARQIAGVVLKSVDEVSGNLDTVQQQIGSYNAETEEGSGLLKDVADNKKAIAANKDSIDLLNAAESVEGSVAHTIAAALKDENNNNVYATVAELNQYKQDVTNADYTTLTEVADQGYITSAALTGYAKTAELKADSVGQTGSFIATISETDGIVSASATEFAKEVTVDGAIAPTAKAVNDFVTGKGYAVASEVNEELAKKLQLTEGLTAGTYLVTVGEGGVVTYTAISVATAEDATKAQQGA